METNNPVCTANTTETTAEKAQRMLHALYAQLGGWKAVAAHLSTEHRKFTKGPLNQIANGHRPPSPAVCAVLGLQPLTKPAPVCATCGEVHVVGWCTHTEGEPRRAALRKPIDEVTRAKRARARTINKARAGVFAALPDVSAITLSVRANTAYIVIDGLQFNTERQAGDVDHLDMIARAFTSYKESLNVTEKETSSTPNPSR